MEEKLSQSCSRLFLQIAKAVRLIFKYHANHPSQKFIAQQRFGGLNQGGNSNTQNSYNFTGSDKDILNSIFQAGYQAACGSVLFISEPLSVKKIREKLVKVDILIDKIASRVEEMFGKNKNLQLDSIFNSKFLKQQVSQHIQNIDNMRQPTPLLVTGYRGNFHLQNNVDTKNSKPRRITVKISSSPQTQFTPNPSSNLRSALNYRNGEVHKGPNTNTTKRRRINLVSKNRQVQSQRPQGIAGKLSLQKPDSSVPPFLQNPPRGVLSELESSTRPITPVTLDVQNDSESNDDKNGQDMQNKAIYEKLFPPSVPPVLSSVPTPSNLNLNMYSEDTTHDYHDPESTQFAFGS